MQVSGWKLEILSSVCLFSEKQNTKQVYEKEEGRGGAGCLDKIERVQTSCVGELKERKIVRLACFTARQSRMVIHFSPTMFNSAVRFSQGVGRLLETVKGRFLSGEYIT